MSEISEIQSVQPSLRVFELVGNSQCFDFTNTVNGRMHTPNELADGYSELLGSYHDLVAWSRQAGIVTDTEEYKLLKEAARHPVKADMVLQRAIEVREVIFRIFYSIMHDSVPDATDISLLNSELAQAMSKACVVGKDGSFVWAWNAQDDDLQRVLWPIVRSAADLLTSRELSAMRICAADDCGWLFLDTSKNKSRRWCDMKSCGNRVKVNRHYERKRQEGHKEPKHV
jgi:predicted RNA-binding Zn ribbon-like protein